MIEPVHRSGRPFVHANVTRIAIGTQCVRALPVPVICGHLALHRHWDGEFGAPARRPGRHAFLGYVLSEADPSEWQ